MNRLIHLKQRSHSFAVAVLLAGTAQCHAGLPEDAIAAAKQATSFLTGQVSIQGGYLWRYSADLSLREGEGVVDTATVWVQPPGTPSVGEAFIRLYEATGDSQFLDAARAVGEALRRGQMRSGGWQAMIEFDPDRRKRWAYRVDPPTKKTKDQSSLDDDKTQSALRFMMQLDRALKFQDKVIHEVSTYALDGLLQKAQMPNGGFPQVWTSDSYDAADRPVKPASYPESWSRTYEGHQEYWYRYTLNDNLVRDVIRTLFLAEKVYGGPRYRAAALKAADFLVLAQMPEPQPAWAQQYSFDMQPIWARKFEPASITGGESQGVIEILLYVYSRTGNRKYLRPIPAALDYLKRSELPGGRLARFYELKTNKPLYFTKDYQLTYDDSDVPTHYSFKAASQVPNLRSEYERLSKLPPDQLSESASVSPAMNPPSAEQVTRLLNGLDHRGAWITNSGLRYHKKPGAVIDMRVTVANLNLLAAYLKSDAE